MSTQPNFTALLDSEDEQGNEVMSVLSSECSDDDWSVVDEADPSIEEIPSDAQINYDVYCATCSNKDFKMQLQYVKDRKDLQGTEVPVTNGRGKKGSSKALETTWVVDDTEEYDFVTDFVSDNQIGMREVNFQQLDAGVVHGKPTQINFLHIFLPLWPGNLKTQIQKLNDRIQKDNENRVRGKVGLLSIREFIQFLAVLLIASLEGKKGSELWQGDETEGEGYRSQIDISRYMTSYRHAQIRKYFPFIFADDTKNPDNEPWWQVSEAIIQFNNSRQRFIRAGRVMVIDESMCAFRPRTTVSGK